MSELAHIKNKLHGRKAGILNQKSHPDAAVLLPLVYEGGELCVLFEVRAHHLNSQPSEICFPGGRIDPTDVSPKAAAIRECSEELGLPKSDIQAIAPLDIVVTPFRGIIFPFVGTIKDIQAIEVNKSEVDHIFTIPLSYLYTYEPATYEMGLHFIPERNFPLHDISNSKAYVNRKDRIEEPFYYYKDYVIWGITARILTHFIALSQAV